MAKSSNGGSPSLGWVFARPSETQRQRNSKLDEHFAGSGSDRSGDIVREGGQNAGDAKDPLVHGPVRVRITLGRLDAAKAAAYLGQLRSHLPEVAKQRGMAGVAAALSGDCPFLAFEDFNTTGLTGNPDQLRRYKEDPSNAFHTFFRAEGQTDKDDDSKQGSKGVGKVVFMAASTVRAVLGLTCRTDGRSLLFGTAVLHTHRLAGTDYDGDAWFGEVAGHRVAPVEDTSVLDRFRSDFNLNRKDGEPGFSVVVPWLNNDPEDGVSAGRIVDAVLREHAWPILKSELVFEVVDFDGTLTTIDALHYLTELDARADTRLKAVRPSAELAQWAIANPPTAPAVRLAMHDRLGVPKWEPGLVSAEQADRLRESLDAGDTVAVRVPILLKPKSGAELESHFDVFLKRDTDAATSPAPTVSFIRGGLQITGMGRRAGQYRGLVVAEDKGMAGFLRAAENPSHTKWNAKPLKDLYKFAPGTLSFVVESVKKLTELLTGDPAQNEVVWTDAISLPAGFDLLPGDGAGKKKRRHRRPITPADPNRPRIVKKRPYDVVTSGDGFVVKPSGLPFKSLPVTLTLRLAYHVRGKDPLAKWHKADFDLSDVAKHPSTVQGCTVRDRKNNRLEVVITDHDFSLRTTGFDTRRELFCKPSLVYPDAVDDPDGDTTPDIRALDTTAIEGGEQ